MKNLLIDNDEIAYTLFIEKNLAATAHSMQDRIGLDLSTDAGAISAVVHGNLYTSVIGETRKGLIYSK